VSTEAVSTKLVDMDVQGLWWDIGVSLRINTMIA
jgi:hypothetical protein